MNVKVDLSFSHDFEFSVLEEFPAGITQRYDFPGGQLVGQDGLLVRVVPKGVGAQAWIGLFARGKVRGQSCTRVLSWPDPQKICVVVNGAGYVIDVNNPEHSIAIEFSPIREVVTIPSVGIVVFGTYTELVAYGTFGVKWVSERVAFDGFKIVSHDGESLKGEYTDLGDDVRHFEVGLDTGSVRSDRGSNRPPDF